MQVTRLKCGGFIFANRVNHAMCDALGIIQFMKAVAEIARGETSPSVPPIWQRELLSARDPPTVTCTHDAYHEEVVDTKNGTNIPSDDDMVVHRSFFFGPKEIAAIRTSLPPHSGGCRKPSSFEILTAYLWRCRNVAIRPDAKELVKIQFIVNVRGKLQSPPMPAGYYGNATAIAAATSLAGELCRRPLGYALELVMNAKDDITEEHMRSLADFLVIKGRPNFSIVRTLHLSDLTRAGFEDVDFGWGKPAYGGPVGCVSGVSFCIPLTNAKGERGILVPILLPGPAMERFEVELETLLKSGQTKPGFSTSFIKPAL